MRFLVPQKTEMGRARAYMVLGLARMVPPGGLFYCRSDRVFRMLSALRRWIEMDSENALDSSFHFSREIVGGGIKCVLYDWGGTTTQSIVCIIASICVCCRRKTNIKGDKPSLPRHNDMTLASFVVDF